MEQTLLQEKPRVQPYNSNQTVINGAEAVMAALIAEEVEMVFGYPGGANLPIYDAFYHLRHKIKHYLARHEQGAIHAAQGYARVTGKPGVCLVTSGPGATNIITGLADAYMDSTPIVCITGQVPSWYLGLNAFQETDVVGVSMPITKWNCQITNAQEIPEIFAKAFYIANSGRKGPVLIDITKDAQMQKLPFEYKKCERLRSYHPYPRPKFDDLKEAAYLINNAKRPFMLIGQGILLSEAQNEVGALANKADIPVASTLLGLSAFPTRHPLYVGMLGLHGNYAPNIKTNECDVLIAVGLRFDDRVTGNLDRYATQAKVIHIEIDPAEIDKNVKSTVSINADAREALQALLPLVNSNSHKEWITSFKELDKVEFEKVIQEDILPATGDISMGEIVHQLSEKTKGQAVIVSDVGQHQMHAARYYRFARTNSHVTSGGLGTMGFALPAAIGAKLGEPNREVIAIIGDGGFQMTFEELGMIAQYKPAVKIVIFNNYYLGMIRQLHDMYYEERDFFGEFVNPDFVKLTDAFGIRTRRVAKREELSDALDEMLASDEAYLLDVTCKKVKNVYPTIPNGKSVGDIILE